MSGMKSVWAIICLTSLPVLLVLPIVGQTSIVEDVEIRGYREVPLEEIKKRIKTAHGKELNADQAVRDFDHVMEIGAFDHFQSSLVIRRGPRGGRIVGFVLKDKP
ncbi:MAG: hypothetical protein AB7P14_01915 [Blastocatellales bacterium]